MQPSAEFADMLDDFFYLEFVKRFAIACVVKRQRPLPKPLANLVSRERRGVTLDEFTELNAPLYARMNGVNTVRAEEILKELGMMFILPKLAITWGAQLLFGGLIYRRVAAGECGVMFTVIYPRLTRGWAEREIYHLRLRIAPCKLKQWRILRF